jgi:hypothetical protein
MASCRSGRNFSVRTDDRLDGNPFRHLFPTYTVDPIGRGYSGTPIVAKKVQGKTVDGFMSNEHQILVTDIIVPQNFGVSRRPGNSI